MQGIPRLQHYVPQFLLKQFAGVSGKLWAYDTENEKLFPASPKSVAAETYFYDQTAERASDKSAGIESLLASAVDRPGAGALAVLLEKGALSGEQAWAFFRFVAAQMRRTPGSLQTAAAQFTPMFQETADRIAKFDPTFRENVITEVRASGASAAELAEFLNVLDEGRFTVEPTREFTIASSLGVIQLITDELAKMRWTFLDVHPSDGDLILGDHPVTLVDAGGEEKPAKPLGLRNPDIEIALPLSPRMVALAHWDGPISYGELAPGMAEMLNERTLRQIQRFAYGSFESEDLLKLAISLRGTGPKMRTRRVQVGEKLLMIPIVSIPEFGTLNKCMPEPFPQARVNAHKPTHTDCKYH